MNTNTRDPLVQQQISRTLQFAEQVADRVSELETLVRNLLGRIGELERAAAVELVK